jgi:hypothetical protein
LYVHKNALSYVVNLDFASKGRKRDFFLNFIYTAQAYTESQANNSAVLEEGGAEVTVLFVRKGKFHEIFGTNISVTVLSVEVLEAGSRLLFVRKGKFHEIFGRNISTIVSGSFGSRRGRGYCL